MSFFDGVNARALHDAPDGFRNFDIGENEAYIDYAQEGRTKDGARTMLTVTFKRDDGAEIRHYIVDNDWKLANLKRLYAAFGIPLHSADVADWFHRRGIVVCKEEVYEGRTYPKISHFKALPGGGRTNGPVNPGYTSPGSGYNANRNERPPSDEFKDDIPF